jgi:glycosyltransferase involved in cell wall biosynthesis
MYRFISKFQYNNWIKNETEKRYSVQCYTGIANEEYVFFDKNESEDYYLWCAGLQWGFEAKGLSIFLELAQANPNDLFIAYGSGNDNISQILSRQQDIKNFRFLGSLQRGRSHREVFGKAKAFIIPTQIPDTFPRTCLESISKGTPIIGSSYGSIPEIIEHNNCGIVCHNIDDYNLAISTIDKFDRQSIFSNSMQYSIDHEIQTLLAYSHNLCQQIKS